MNLPLTPVRFFRYSEQQFPRQDGGGVSGPAVHQLDGTPQAAWVSDQTSEQMLLPPRPTAENALLDQQHFKVRSSHTQPSCGLIGRGGRWKHAWRTRIGMFMPDDFRPGLHARA